MGKNATGNKNIITLDDSEYGKPQSVCDISWRQKILWTYLQAYWSYCDNFSQMKG